MDQYWSTLVFSENHLGFFWGMPGIEPRAAGSGSMNATTMLQCLKSKLERVNSFLRIRKVLIDQARLLKKTLDRLKNGLRRKKERIN